MANLWNHFRRVSACLFNQKDVEITRRGKPFARFNAVPPEQKRSFPKIDFAAQRRAVWGTRKFSEEEVAAMRQAERAGEEG